MRPRPLPAPLLLLVVSVFLIMGLAACVGVDGRPLAETLIVDAGAPETSQPAPPPSSAPKSDAAKPSVRSNALLDALEYAPDATTMILFTDWAAVKDRLGMAELNSSADEEARLAFRLTLPNEPITSMYGIRHFLFHAANWGWDSLDLEWEATIQIEDRAPVYVLRFQTDEPLDRLRGILEEREFDSGFYAGVPAYAHLLDPSADWIRTTELAILNIAMFESDRTLLLSPNGKSMSTLLDAVTSGATVAENSDTWAAVERLGEVITAIVMQGEAACLSFEVNPLLSNLDANDLSAEAMQEKIDRVMPARPQSLYTALAIGRESDEAAADSSAWKVVMRYPAAELAQTDLPQRRIIAEQGMSIVREIANQEIFTVQDAVVQGNDAVIWLAPVSGNARFLMDKFFRRDLSFLACP